MTFLDCTVTGCIYNADQCCCKGDIKVEGKEARNTCDTRCGSFVERKASDMTNVEKRVTKSIDVACEACHCKFNEAEKCAAEHIGIAGGEACRCGETQCASFQCRA